MKERHAWKIAAIILLILTGVCFIISIWSVGDLSLRMFYTGLVFGMLTLIASIGAV